MGRKRIYEPEKLEIGQRIYLTKALVPAARHYAFQWRKKYNLNFQHGKDNKGKTFIERIAPKQAGPNTEPSA